MDNALSGKPKRINFIPRLREKTPTAKKPVNLMLVLVIVLAVAVMAVEGFTLWQYYTDILPEYNKISDALNDEQLNLDYAEVAGVQSTINALRTVDNALKTAIAAIDSYPVMDRAIINLVNITAGMDVTVNAYSYDNASGMLTLSCSTEKILRTSDYAESLRLSGIFLGVQVFGYTLETYTVETTTVTNGETATTTADHPRYSFSVICYLKGGVGDA